MQSLLNFIKSFFGGQTTGNTIFLTQEKMHIEGNMELAGGDITKTITIIQQQQDFEIEKFAIVVNSLVIEIEKSYQNIMSYNVELGVLAERQNYYSEDEMRHKLVRLFDRIENEIFYMIDKVRNVNNYGRMAIFSFEMSRNQALQVADMDPNIDRQSAVRLINATRENRSKSQLLLEKVEKVVLTIKKTMQIDNMPRRISTAGNSLIREMEDLADFARRWVQLASDTIRLVESKVQ